MFSDFRPAKMNVAGDVVLAAEAADVGSVHADFLRLKMRRKSSHLVRRLGEDEHVEEDVQLPPFGMAPFGMAVVGFADGARAEVAEVLAPPLMFSGVGVFIAFMVALVFVMVFMES